MPSCPRVLLIDNYDSFVFNLARYFCELGCETRTVRNDSISPAEILQQLPAAIVISPGPCTPAESEASVEIVRTCGPTIPLLGVCLGHQAIATACGGRVIRSLEPIHGRTTPIVHASEGLFHGLPSPLTVGRYHSLIVDEQTLPSELRVTARTESGTVMAIEHARHSVFGVQFHPESVLTESGHRLLANFLHLAGITSSSPPAPEYTPPVDEDDFYRLPIAREAGPPVWRE